MLGTDSLESVNGNLALVLATCIVAFGWMYFY